MKRINLTLLTLLTVTIMHAIGQKVDSVRSGDLTIYYEIYGGGQPIYLLSGGPGISPYSMKEVALELSKTHQAVLVHQRGTGKTKVPVNEQTIQINSYCQDLKAIKNKLKHNKISLLGHSWGGMLAMQYSVSYPEDVARNILVCSGSYNLRFFEYFGDNVFSRLSKDDQSSVLAIEKFYGSLERNPDQARVQKELDELLGAYQGINIKGYVYDKRHVDTFEFTGDGFNAQVLQLMIGSLAKSNWDLHEQLSIVKAKTLIIQGRQDPVDLETGRAINNAIKESQFVILERCGHFPWIEKSEEFYKTVNDFIEQTR